jgi:hypothetical protein
VWTQIVGKIRKTFTPLINHWWNVTLYVNSRGLTTSLIPFRQGGFEMQFDFLDHQLILTTSEGALARIPLAPRSVADFYDELMHTLQSLGIDAKIRGIPDEVANPIPFAEDRVHASYDAEFANRFWRVLLSTDRVLHEFRSLFLGKCSPVHFFWGSFDLCVTRFSGRRAPERREADAITREAYSHEVSSAGFWPGAGFDGPAFYAYSAPAPPGLEKQKVRPQAAMYHPKLSEFILMYDDVRASHSPENALMEFLQSTYAAGASLAGWDRTALEKSTVA